MCTKANPQVLEHVYAGPSRATAGPRETFLRGPQKFSRGLSGRHFFKFFFQIGTFWRTLYFWPTAGHPNVARPGVANPPLPHPLDGSAVNFGTMCIYTKFSNRKNQFSI